MGFFDTFATPQGAKAAGQAIGAAASGDWGAAAQALGQQAVKKVTVRTQFSPPIEVDPFASTPPGTPVNPILALVKPSVTIEGPGGSTTISPWGEPSANYLPWLVGGVVVVALGVVAVIAAIARRTA